MPLMFQICNSSGVKEL